MERAGGVLFSLIGALLLVLAAAGCGDEEVAVRVEPTFTPGNDTERVSIVIAEDEIVLIGHLFGRQNQVGVILAHMRPNDQRAWFEFAQRLSDEGLAALTFDFRGYGESEGDKDPSKLDEDLSEALRYMQVDLGLDTVFVVGASMGGTTSLVVAAQENVAGVVAVSAPSEFEEQDALSAVPNVEEPKLFIASEEDTAAVLSLEEFLGAAGEPKDSEVYPGNAHGTDLLQSERSQEFQERIIEFLREQNSS